MKYQPKILFVLTSHDKLGDTGKRTGFHYEELSAPYYILSDAGVEVTIASVQGGEPCADPSSIHMEDKSKNPESVNRFIQDDKAMVKLYHTLKIDEVDMESFDGIFLPGGHGCMWDFPDCKPLQKLLLNAYDDEKIISAVCHAPAAFVNLEKSGKPLIEGIEINSFTDSEEKAAEKENIVPFSLESALRAQGCVFKSTKDFEGICVVDMPFITGQNPASAEKVANEIVRRLNLKSKLKEVA